MFFHSANGKLLLQICVDNNKYFDQVKWTKARDNKYQTVFIYEWRMLARLLTSNDDGNAAQMKKKTKEREGKGKEMTML